MIQKSVPGFKESAVAMVTLFPIAPLSHVPALFEIEQSWLSHGVFCLFKNQPFVPSSFSFLFLVPSVCSRDLWVRQLCFHHSLDH